MKIKNSKLKITSTTSSAFTLMEVLIVTALIAVLGAAGFALFNPQKQLQKSWDAKKRYELSSLQKAFEDYYNDKGEYPDGAKICYNSVTINSGVCSCNICGNKTGSPASLSPYINTIPCDPSSALGKDYYYQYSCSDRGWFKIYTKLNDQSSGTGYNYGVSSGNTNVEPYPTP